MFVLYSINVNVLVTFIIKASGLAGMWRAALPEITSMEACCCYMQMKTDSYAITLQSSKLLCQRAATRKCVDLERTVDHFSIPPLFSLCKVLNRDVYRADLCDISHTKISLPKCHHVFVVPFSVKSFMVTMTQLCIINF